MQPLRVIIAGGGTGGHIFPAIAVGHALRRLSPGVQLLFVGAIGKMEMEKVPLEGFDIVGLDISGFNRNNLLKNLTLPFKLIRSFFKANKILKEFKPQAVVGVGGYASFPMLDAAQKQHIPTLIQEQNSYAGKSNQMLAKKARVICVAYEKMAHFFPKDKLVVTGNPVRKSISQMTLSREDGQRWLGLDSSKKTVLIVGGSLGAKSINETVHEQLEEIIGEDVQVIWQTGKLYYEEAMNRARPLKTRVRVFEFIREMDYAYAAADLVISRAGALAIAELCIAAKPVIFVPYPFAAEDHQTSNAMTLVTQKAAWMVKDSEVKKKLVPRLQSLLHDGELQQTMSNHLKILAITDADERIAKQVIQIAGAGQTA